MKDSSLLHPDFTFNGLQFETTEELFSFAHSLIKEGDDFEVSIGRFIHTWLDENEEVKVKTSGSTGKPKKMVFRKKQMQQSAKATGTYFKLGAGTSALLCLNTDYIAGKMMLVRAMTLGWNLHVVAPEKDALTQYDNDYDFVAMVPYQVYHSVTALKKVKKLLVGGGIITSELENALQEVPTEVFASYGMTETISHIAIRRVNGPAATHVYATLPDVKCTTDDRGCLVIHAPLLVDEAVVTNDIIELISPTSFTWLGRYDNLINSGGVKIFPETIEEKLAEVIKIPFIVASEKDDALGERVILILEKKNEATTENYAEAFSKLKSYEKPKKIYTLSNFPYTETGKIKRGDVLKVLQKYK